MQIVRDVMEEEKTIRQIHAIFVNVSTEHKMASSMNANVAAAKVVLANKQFLSYINTKPQNVTSLTLHSP